MSIPTQEIPQATQDEAPRAASTSKTMRAEAPRPAKPITEPEPTALANGPGGTLAS